MCCREMSTETYVETIIFSAAEVNSLDSQLTHLYLQDHQKCDSHELTLNPVDLPGANSTAELAELVVSQRSQQRR